MVMTSAWVLAPGTQNFDHTVTCGQFGPKITLLVTTLHHWFGAKTCTLNILHQLQTQGFWYICFVKWWGGWEGKRNYGSIFKYKRLLKLFKWCTIMSMYLISLNYTLKMVKTVNFMLHIFYHNLKGKTVCVWVLKTMSMDFISSSQLSNKFPGPINNLL